MCRKEYYNDNLVKTKTFSLENRNRIKDCYLEYGDRIKEYQLKIHNKSIDRKKNYSSIRLKTDINFRLICKKKEVEFNKF